MYRHILIPTDGSELAERGVTHGLAAIFLIQIKGGWGNRNSARLIFGPLRHGKTTERRSALNKVFPRLALLGFIGTANLSPPGASIALAGRRFIIPDHALAASRVAYAWWYMLSPLPRRGNMAFLASPAVSAFERGSGRALSFSRLARLSLVSWLQLALVTRIPKASTSIAAGMLSGWSVCRVSLCTHCKALPCSTAYT